MSNETRRKSPKAAGKRSRRVPSGARQSELAKLYAGLAQDLADWRRENEQPDGTVTPRRAPEGSVMPTDYDKAPVIWHLHRILRHESDEAASASKMKDLLDLLPGRIGFAKGRFQASTDPNDNDVKVLRRILLEAINAPMAPYPAPDLNGRPVTGW